MDIQEPGFVISLVLHILSAMVAVGAVTVTDYLHIIGLKSKRREQKLMFVYPHLARMIQIAIVGVILSGAGLLYFKPELLQSELFQFKMVLFAIVILNGAFLHIKIYPAMVAAVKEQKPLTSEVLFSSSFSGALSVVTWYSILILAIIKPLAFTVLQFLVWYILALIIAFGVGFAMETRMRRFR